jgi:rhodanese-related sulfurtransferase
VSARSRPRSTVDELLAEARSGLRRLSAPEAASAAERGGLLIDIRSDSQRDAGGVIPGSIYIPRNVLEWRLDPASAHCDPVAARRGLPLILICNEGYQSSLAAATLTRFGLDATDVIGGFQAWREAGLPVRPTGEASAGARRAPSTPVADRPRRAARRPRPSQNPPDPG